MWGKILSFFTGGGGKTIENIAMEWIETGKEKAEAGAVMLKTLDPNGIMRRELSRKVSQLYTIYIVTTLILLTIEFCAVMFGVELSQVQIDQLTKTTSKLVELFVPITTLFGAIVSASFGVNYANIRKDK